MAKTPDLYSGKFSSMLSGCSIFNQIKKDYFMCLVSPTKIPYVAPDDLFCYKVLNEVKGQLVTPFRDFPMELNKLYTTDDISQAKSNELTAGFLHAYASPSYMYKRIDQYTSRLGNRPAMYLAVIPKGTKFFVNSDCTELCATALKVIKKIVDLERDAPFLTTAIDLKEQPAKHTNINKTFDTYKESLTTMENIVKFAKDNNLYTGLVNKYEIFEEGSYEKNLYAYRLIVAVLTEDEKNSLVNGQCYYPYVSFYTGEKYSNLDSKQVKVGTIIHGDTCYEVMGGHADDGVYAGLGHFYLRRAMSIACVPVGFRSVSRREIAEFISRHFGRLIFDLMYGCANCDYRWIEEND